MSDSQNPLATLYAEWRRLAEAEGSAIRSGNWPLVSECQHAIRLLQSTIDRLTPQNQSANGSGAQMPRQPARGTILELIELQRKNLLALQQRRERLSAQVEHVTRTGRNLRGIQRSYGVPVPAAWSSYS